MELWFPDDRNVSTGKLDFVLQPSALLKAGLVTVTLFSEPVFAVRVDMSLATRRMMVQVGRAEITPPNWAVFLLPEDLDPTVALGCHASFADWQVTYAAVGDVQLDLVQQFTQPPKQDTPLVQIAPSLQNFGMTARDVIQAICSLMLSIDEVSSGLLLRVVATNYHLEVGFTEEHFYIARNDDRVETPIQSGKIICFAGWQPAKLLVCLTEARELDQEALETATVGLVTRPTLPPYSLVDWARRQAIVAATSYGSRASFYESVTSALQSVLDKVTTLGLQSAFWDKTYNGRRVVLQRPKSEPDVQPAIHGLLFDICLAKNILVSREYIIGGGELDFLFSGQLSTGEPAAVCVEFKHAHSADLESGLLSQLSYRSHGRLGNALVGLLCF